MFFAADHTFIPWLCFSAASAAALISTFLLPEMRGQPLLMTVADAEASDNAPSLKSLCKKRRSNGE